jgi:hypothetical protein
MKKLVVAFISICYLNLICTAQNLNSDIASLAGKEVRLNIDVCEHEVTSDSLDSDTCFSTFDLIKLKKITSRKIILEHITLLPGILNPYLLSGTFHFNNHKNIPVVSICKINRKDGQFKIRNWRKTKRMIFKQIQFEYKWYVENYPELSILYLNSFQVAMTSLRTEDNINNYVAPVVSVLFKRLLENGTKTDSTIHIKSIELVSGQTIPVETVSFFRENGNEYFESIIFNGDSIKASIFKGISDFETIRNLPKPNFQFELNARRVVVFNNSGMPSSFFYSKEFTMNILNQDSRRRYVEINVTFEY